MENDNTNELVSTINTNYSSAKKGTVENPQVVAGAIRSALEGAVKLCWQIKYDKIPVWINGGREEFSLYEAINSVRFTKFFNTLEISDMNTIRKICNDVLHGNAVFTIEIASELLARLEKCIRAIERITGKKILGEDPDKDDNDGDNTDPTPPIAVESIVLDINSLKLCIGGETLIHATVLPDNATNKAVIWSCSDSSVATVKNGMVTACGEGTCTVTATAEDGGFKANCSIFVQPTEPMGRNIPLDHFWKIFEQILIENGEPFKIIHEKDGEQTYWACPNKNRAFTDNCVDISLVRQKGFIRVGLYVINRNTRIGQILLANRENIDRQIPFEHVWEAGTKNPNTLRIDTKFPIADRTSREIIENALPYIMKYIEIAKIYGPDDFFDY